MKQACSLFFLCFQLLSISFSNAQPMELVSVIDKENYNVKRGDRLELKITLLNQTDKKITLPFTTPVKKDNDQNYLGAKLEILFSESQNGKYKNIDYTPPFYDYAQKSDYPDPTILLPKIRKTGFILIGFGVIYTPGFYKIKAILPYYSNNSKDIKDTYSNQIYVVVK